MAQACAHCGYQRTSTDSAPAEECPMCHIAYAVAPTNPFAGHRSEMTFAMPVLRADASLATLSIVIGICHFVRITKAEQRDGTTGTAVFFAAHYGLFHAGYLVFITVGAKPGELAAPAVYVLCGAAFAINHLHSLRRNLAKDAVSPSGREASLLLFFPYARIVPMHLVIVGGLVLNPHEYGVLVFGVLKTAADAVMHLIEQS